MFKSKAQRDYVLKQVKEGKIAQGTFDKWDAETPDKIPTRIQSTRAPKLKKARTAKVIK